MATNQTTMIGPNKAATLAVPRLCTANSATRMATVSADDIMVERRRRELQALDRRKHRNRRRDHGIAEEHRGADHAEEKTSAVRRPSARLASAVSDKRAALAVVVGAQQDQNVFDRDDDDQRPEDERQHAEHGVPADRTGGRLAATTASRKA